MLENRTMIQRSATHLSKTFATPHTFLTSSRSASNSCVCVSSRAADKSDLAFSAGPASSGRVVRGERGSASVGAPWALRGRSGEVCGRSVGGSKLLTS